MASPSELSAGIDDRIAAQWIALGGQLDGIDDRTVIDLEALVAITATRELEARVREVAVDWGAAYGRVISVHRLRAVAGELDVDETRLADFAGDVAAAGGPKWPMAADRESQPRRGKVVVRGLGAPGRLAWRTRAAFGVNARADILTILLSTPPGPISISDLTRRTRFTKKLITVAVADMSLAGIVVKTRIGREDRVSLPPESPLRDLLEPDGIPAVDWATRWRVVLAMESVDDTTSDVPTAVRLIETRTVADKTWPELDVAALPRPNLSLTGPDWEDEFRAWRDSVGLVMSLKGA